MNRPSAIIKLSTTALSNNVSMHGRKDEKIKHILPIRQSYKNVMGRLLNRKLEREMIKSQAAPASKHEVRPKEKKSMLELRTKRLSGFVAM